MESRNALSWKDIFELKRKGEKKRVDFKTRPFIEDNDEISAQLTAFANRYGGRILIGVKDEEYLQGWDALEGLSIDRDKTLGHISNIAMNNCSPPVDFSSDFLTSDKGDVLVLNIERRKNIPHAVVGRVGHEIKKRIYYIRTESGKRLANDRMLSYMFRNLEDPHLEYNFGIGMQYMRDDFGIPDPMFNMRYDGLWNIIPFMHFKETDIKFLKEEDPDRIRFFFVELLPYAMLGFLSQHFMSSWDVKIEKIGDSTGISPFRDVDKKEMKTENITDPPETSLLSNLSLDIKSVLRNQFFRLMLPPETEVEIVLSSDPLRRSELRLTRHNSFEFVFSFREGLLMAGAGSLTPLYGVLDNIGEYTELRKGIANIIMRANLSFHFAFPDIDDPLFEKIYHWAQLIIDLVREQWDWDILVRKLPEKKLFFIETYLKKILDALEKKDNKKG